MSRDKESAKDDYKMDSCSSVQMNSEQENSYEIGGLENIFHCANDNFIGWVDIEEDEVIIAADGLAKTKDEEDGSKEEDCSSKEEETNQLGSKEEDSQQQNLKQIVMDRISEQLELAEKRKEMETMEEMNFPIKRRRMFRGLINQYLEGFVIHMKLSPLRGFKKCPFFKTGCTTTFRNEYDLRLHLFDCFYGVFQLCKTGMCDFGFGQVFREMSLFFNHVASVHSCTTTNGMEETGIQLMIKRTFWNIKHNGYQLELLRRFNFDVEGLEVRVLVGLIMQRIGMGHFRMLFAPIAYNEDGTPIHHSIRVEMTIRGRDGVPILPISGPEFSADTPCATTISSVFNSSKDFIDACVQMDAVVSYDSRDFIGETLKAVCMDVKFTPFRCILERDEAEFPPVPFSLLWDDLAIHPNIRPTMDDKEQMYPSEVTSILVPQLQGQNDVMVECLDVKAVTNGVRTAVLDFIIRNGIRPHCPTRTPLAWIIYPSASLLRQFVPDWKRHGMALGVKVYSLESHFPEVQTHLKRVGCDILITTPSALQSLIQEAEPMFKDELTRDVKFVFLADHYQNCFPEQMQRLHFCLDHISAQENATIKIAHVQCMHPDIKRHSTTSLTYQDAPSFALFTRGWNLFSIGQDPKSYIEGLQFEVIKYSSFRDRINRTIEIIKDRGNMRWLVVGMNVNLLESLGKDIDDELHDTSRVKYLTQEDEIMMNCCFWDEFILRSDSVMIGPYFLLESPESHCLDGLILLTEPIYPAENARIRQIVQRPDGSEKNVILFKLKS